MMMIMMMMMVRRRVRKRCMRARSEAMPEDAFRSEALTRFWEEHVRSAYLDHPYPI